MTVHHRIGATALVVTAALGAALWGAWPANAGEVTLQYECTLSPFPAQGMTLRLTWDAPESVPVGRPTPVIPVHGTATMGDVVTQVLGMIGATTVEGSLDASGVVVAPEGNVPVAVSVTVPPTAVPASGPITIEGSGATPPLVFHDPGHAVITADNGFTVRIVPRDANGNVTVAGQLDASCALDAGQNNVLTSFEITAPSTPPTRTSPGPTRSAVVGPTATTTTTRTTTTTTPEPSGATDPSAATAAPASIADPTGTGSVTSAVPTTGFATAPVVHRVSASRIVASGAVLAAGVALLCCVWWLRRRQRRGRGY